MNEQEAFDLIDIAIDELKHNDRYGQGMKVSKTPHSDWLGFNWRQLTWTGNDLKYLIEIFPHFKESEKIESLTLYAAVWFDSAGARYSLKKAFSDRTTLDFIAIKATDLIVEAYQYINRVNRSDIPFAVKLSKI
jgi:hypothetical protein